MTHPTVYIITPLYNTSTLLRATVDSVLQQSYAHFKLVLVDDKSTDDTKAIAKKIAKTDNRIVVLENATNGGQYKGGNTGLEYACKHGGDNDFIYILDHDDLLMPHGIATQITHMQSHPHIDILGAGLQCFGDSDKKLTSYEKDNDLIHMGLLFNSTMAHPATMIRISVIGKMRYEKKYAYAHDYHFFVKLALDGGCTFANLGQPAYLYRVHQSQISHKNKPQVIQSADGVRRDILGRMGITDKNIIQTHLHLCHKSPNQIETPEQWADYFTALVDGNSKTKLFSTDKFPQFLAHKILRNMYRTGKNAVAIYQQMPDTFKHHVSVGQIIKLYLSALRPVKSKKPKS